jgi:hypothetical protein
MQPTAGLVFVALVTCWLLARLLGGGSSAEEVVLYGATATCGLEFLIAVWSGLWERRAETA